MSITGVQNQSSLIDLLKLYVTKAVNATSSSDTATSTSGTAGSTQTDSVDLSNPAKAYAELQKLQQSDPDKFKALCAKISDQLNTAATQQTDDKSAKMLSDLAAKFKDVSQGGDISELAPPPPPPGGGPNGQYAQASQSSDDKLTELLTSLLSDSNSSTNGTGSSSIQQLLANILSQASGKESKGGGGPSDGVKQVLSNVFSEIDAAAA